MSRKIQWLEEVDHRRQVLKVVYFECLPSGVLAELERHEFDLVESHDSIKAKIRDILRRLQENKKP